MLDDRSDTGAARGDDLLLQAVGVEAAALLPPQHQDLLLDGHGVEAVVLLPQGAHTAGQAAPGIGDHPREAVGIVIQAEDGDTTDLCTWTAWFGRIFLFISPSSYLPVHPHYETQRISLSSTFSQ